MTLLSRVASYLDRAGVRHALVGASALAVHGVSRSTADQDLLVTSREVLQAPFWSALANATADVRVGDADDPLLGVIRITHAAERPVDVIVGRPAWMSDVLARGSHLALAGMSLPVVDAADLVLLKLYAGGSQDLRDIEQLLVTMPALRDEVGRRVTSLPEAMNRAWSQFDARRR